MIKVIINGCNGKMGRVLVDMINEDSDMEVIAGIDSNSSIHSPFKVYSSPGECEHKADVIIDFSHHSAVPALIDYCVSSKTPVVVATTALEESEYALIKEAAKETAIFQSANMSLGINIMKELLKKAMPPLEENFNVELIEKHHNKKVDSPSGTAFLLADAINESCETKKDYIYGRHGKADACKITDLGIHAIRGGTIPGEHTVIFAGPDEIIEIKHSALSRNIFASGAVKAAKYLAQFDKGLYSMEDLLAE